MGGEAGSPGPAEATEEKQRPPYKPAATALALAFPDSVHHHHAIAGFAARVVVASGDGI
jgi:hypothetical protein